MTRHAARPCFLATGDAASGQEELLMAVRSALNGSFTVTRSRAPHRISRTWLDTFDWRLYRAGLTLEQRAGELVLADRSGEIARQRPGEDRAARSASRGIARLAPGPVASRIASLIDPRALVPVGAIRGSAAAFALLNDERKTVARLELDWPDPPDAWHGGDLPSAPRLTITEIRGYTAQARRAAALLGAAPDIEPARGTVFAAALAMSGRRAAEYSNKINADITGSEPATEAVSTILLRLLDILEANVDGVLRDIDTEFLHDLRVSVRRTRSALKLLGGALDLNIDRFRAEFKWLGDLTTPVRDLDVHLLDFDETAAGLKAAAPADLAPLREYLLRRRVAEFRRLARGLRSDRFRALTEDWRKELLAARNARPRRASAKGSAKPSARAAAQATVKAGAFGAQRTRAAYTKLASKGSAITETSPPEALHDLRKLAKEVRYALEFFAPLYQPDDYDPVLGDLKKLQDCLGEYQDTQVQMEEIRALADGLLADRDHPVPAATLLAMGEIIAGLAERQDLARADFGRRFASFAGRDGRRRISDLLSGGDRRNA
jgi:CHAD domain-containing protein